LKEDGNRLKEQQENHINQLFAEFRNLVNKYYEALNVDINKLKNEIVRKKYELETLNEQIKVKEKKAELVTE
jgi:hypothetical protein